MTYKITDSIQNFVAYHTIDCFQEILAIYFAGYMIEIREIDRMNVD